MFILVPTLLIFASLTGIIYIAYRKMPYLKKLTPESHEVGHTILHDLFPEITDLGQVTKVKEFRQSLLRETEKLLRRLRLVSLKIDHASEALIKRIRKVHLTNHLETQALQLQKDTEIAVQASRDDYSGVTPSMEELKDREQRLILEIARNPKDAQLYGTLGDLYMAMHNKHEAEEAYKAGHELNPSDEVLARKYSQVETK